MVSASLTPSSMNQGRSDYVAANMKGEWPPIAVPAASATRQLGLPVCDAYLDGSKQTEQLQLTPDVDQHCLKAQNARVLRAVVRAVRRR